MGWLYKQKPAKAVRALALTIFTASMSFLQLQQTAYAMNGKYDEAFFSSNKLLIYDPNSGACTTSAGAVSGNGNIAKIYNYLVGKGLSAAQAGGILGNLGSEGGYSATRQEDPNKNGEPQWPKGGYGIAQWTGGRRTILVDAIKKYDSEHKADKAYLPLMNYYDQKYGHGVNKTSGYVAEGLPVNISDQILQVELDFLYQEATNRTVRHDIDTGAKGKTEWESVAQATDITDATRIWYYNFERPLTQNEAGVQQRTQRGKDALKEIGVSESSTGAVGGTSGCTLSANGDVATLQKFVKNYAWSSYKGHGFVTPTEGPDGYGEAIKKGQADGLNVGGTKLAGIDCGGYVKLLMHYSGWDPTFNYSGKGGATGSPTTEGSEWYWLEHNWEKVDGTGHIKDTKQLRPGDVAMEDGHTWVFVGTIDGFDSNQSSASWDNRAPMASSSAEAAKATQSSTTWYRKKGTSPAV